MLDALERHPGIRLGLHYTGPAAAVAGRQPARGARPDPAAWWIAARSRSSAAATTSRSWSRCRTATATASWSGWATSSRRSSGGGRAGAWLAERVWEPSLAYDLAAAGYDWTVLDDNHLRAASISEDEMWTAFTTDDRGKRLTVFGTEQGLRYRIPFKPVEDVISYLADRRTDDGRFVGMMGDDGEKFGAWPGTFEYCWSREHWVDRCFEAIEASRDWLSTVTPSEWLDRAAAHDTGLLPHRLVRRDDRVGPAPRTRRRSSSRLLEDARERDLPAARFLRGGFWRNYAARYREINELHKQMLRVSEKVDAMPDAGPAGRRARARPPLPGPVERLLLARPLRRHLHRPHAHGHAGPPDRGRGSGRCGRRPRPAARRRYGARLADTDLDAIDEVLVTTPGQTVVVDLAEGAGISSWDLRASRVALASVLRRRPEAYHERLVAARRAAEEAAIGDGRGAAGGHAAAAATRRPGVHPRHRTTKEPGLAAFLHYDRHERRSGLVHLLPADGSTDRGSFVARHVRRARRLRRGRVRADASWTPTASSPGGSAPSTVDGVDAAARASRRPSGSAAGGSTRRSTRGRAREPGRHRRSPSSWRSSGTSTCSAAATTRRPTTRPTPASARPHDIAGEVAAAVDDRLRQRLRGRPDRRPPEPAARLTWYPVETVSNSEGGFERVYQGSSLLFRWPVALAPGEQPHVHGPASTSLRRSTATVGATLSSTALTQPAPKVMAPTGCLGRGLPARLPLRYHPPSESPKAGRARPFLSAGAPRPVQRRDRAPAGRRAVPRLERADRRRVLQAQRRARQPPPRLVRPRAHAGRLAGRPRRRPRTRASSTRTCRRQPTSPDCGNAMAQAYHHAILPLASLADRRTEIRWGLRDFELRFGRRPTGIWLPETAVDLPTLRILADEGIHYTILAPWQAADSRLDTRRPYRVELGGGKSIVVVFYDAALSAVGLVRVGRHDGRRLVRARPDPAAPRRPGLRRRHAAHGRHRHRRRAVRPPPEVPRPVPRPPRQPRPGRARSRLRRHHRRPGRRRHARRARSRRRRSPSGLRGAATTACCAGTPSAPTPPTAAGRARCASPLERLASAIDTVADGPGRRLHGARRRSGRPATSTWTSSSARRRPTTSRGGCLPLATRRAARPASSTCSRPNAGGWPCSPATAGSGTTRSGPRPSRSCCARPRPRA